MEHTHRLSDPLGIAPKQITSLQKKLSIAMGILARGPDAPVPGNPFVFAFTVERPHFLYEFEETKPAENAELFKFDPNKTCFSDGEKYNWHPDYLEALSNWEIQVILEKISYHMICNHYGADRTSGKVAYIWEWARTYNVCATIESDYIHKGKIYSHDVADNKDHPLWSGNLGTPLLFQELLDAIEGKPINPKKQDPPNGLICADVSQNERSVEDIYYHILKHIKLHHGPEGIEKFAPENHPTLKYVKNIHAPLNIKTTRDKMLQRALRAADSAKKMRGTIPSNVVEELGELQSPVLTWEDFSTHSIRNKRRQKGMENCWTAPRRRAMALKLYMPQKKDPFINVIVLLDTSGSMSQEDITYGVSQLQVLDTRAKITVVPVDAEPHWKDATIVNSAMEIPKIKIVGRGGTVFSDFFNHYSKHIDDPPDLIIVITDGYFGTLDIAREPPCPTVWVLSNNDPNVSVPFGKAFPMIVQKRSRYENL